jgi:hypothetical protein
MGTQKGNSFVNDKPSASAPGSSVKTSSRFKGAASRSWTFGPNISSIGISKNINNNKRTYETALGF